VGRKGSGFDRTQDIIIGTICRKVIYICICMHARTVYEKLLSAPCTMVFCVCICMYMCVKIYTHKHIIYITYIYIYVQMKH
jgi:hypothetical protein